MRNIEIFIIFSVRTFFLAIRRGVYGLISLCSIPQLHGAEEASTGSPREILQLGYKLGFVDDSAVWLLMLKKRNTPVHMYNEDEVDEMILLIRDSFIPAFVVLEKTLQDKLSEAEADWA